MTSTAIAPTSQTPAHPRERPHATLGALPVNRLLHGPLLPTLVRLALPTVAVLFMTTVLSVAETYFVSSLGLEAIAAASLVVPIMMLQTMVSNGGIGGGVSSAIARARGAGRDDDAQSLAWHALVIAVVAGALFSLVAIGAGKAIYGSLYGLIAITSELYFAGQGARRIGWPMAGGAIRFALATIAGVAVLHADMKLDTAFALVAAGIAMSSAISLWGFRVVRWSA